jgi:hypothetical protein
MAMSFSLCGLVSTYRGAIMGLDHNNAPFFAPVLSSSL